VDETTRSLSAVADPKLRLILSGNPPDFHRMYRSPFGTREKATEAFLAEAAVLAPLGYLPNEEVLWEDPPMTPAARLLRGILIRLFPRLVKDETFLYVTYERSIEAR
jgi:hypothetical protein